MYFRWGAYLSNLNEAGLAFEREDITSPATGLLLGVKERWTINGFLQAASPVLLAGLCTALDLAFSANFMPAQLIANNGYTVLRQLAGLTPLGGTRVVSGPSYPYDGTSDAEFSTYRRYRVQIEGAYVLPTAAAFDNPTLVWQESINVRGSGGPTFVFRQPRTGKPQKQITSRITTVIIEQRGHAVGLKDWPIPAEPLFPEAVHQEASEIKKDNPQRAGTVYFNYPISWTYVMQGLPVSVINPPIFQGR